ncbi:histidine phosphatase family protein [Lacticigenium naphthae]|uniref:histidine phosphatase family protein n=1 Tax=Lacticigenium naphthae TaxID=515351 RepID=UPI00040451A3|nr:histidine phosphatase family protein [Lacticigenium naphthae]
MAKKGVTFYFVRHGETYLNHYGRMQGWSNAPLTDSGVRDVKRSGEGLADVKFDAVYSSDLTRTIETARIILGENKHAFGLSINEMKQFREVFFGSFEGDIGSNVWTKVADELGFESKKEMFRNTTIPERMNGTLQADPYHDAEDFMTFWSRIEEGLLELVDRHRDTGENVLVVAHGGTIRYLLINLLPELKNPDSLLNASVSVASYYEGKYHLESYNDVSHFTDID